ncbi:MAG: hypothetical protein JSV88_02545 [Candidatus Aminicenantes bacterium]|nr:MAG: hypothetical protein JSV88_02545 [Candidatus Aminicenantes bacterium]
MGSNYSAYMGEKVWTQRILSCLKRYYINHKYELGFKRVASIKDVFDDREIVKGKIFGIQIKEPVYEERDTKYKLDKGQHILINGNKWLFYVFPEIILSEQYRNSLYRSLFSPGEFEFNKKIGIGEIENDDGKRWGTIAKAIEIDDRIGIRMLSDNDKGAITKHIEDYHSPVISINIKKKKVILFGYSELFDRRVFIDPGRTTSRTKRVTCANPKCRCQLTIDLRTGDVIKMICPK